LVNNLTVDKKSSQRRFVKSPLSQNKYTHNVNGSGIIACSSTFKETTA